MVDIESPAKPATRYLLFAACAPGLEALLSAELAEWGMTSRASAGGVELRGELSQLWTLCRRTRLAESVRVRLKPFVAKDFATLIRELERLPWSAYVPAEGAIDVRVTCRKSRLWHSEAVAERVLFVVRQRTGNALATEGQPALLIYVRIVRDRVQVSIDAGGDRLHRRGYRTHVAEASLRETLAAALVRVAEQYAPSPPVLWDPFCGAGTIALEWLESKLARAAGARRSFSFEIWPTHDPAMYQKWLEAQLKEETQHPQSPEALRVIGSDVSKRALDAARANAENALLAPWCRWILGDFEETARQVPQGALVLSNPPYGVRVTAGDRRGAVLARLGELLQRRPDLRPVALLLPQGARVPTLGRERFVEALRTSNGGLPVAIQVLR